MQLKQVDPLTFKLIAFIKEEAYTSAERYASKELEEVDRQVELGRSKAFHECLKYYNDLLSEDNGGQHAGNE